MYCIYKSPHKDRSTMMCVCVCLCLSDVPTFRGQGGLGQVQEAQSLVETTHLLDQVGDSWQEGQDNKMNKIPSVGFDFSSE